MRLGIIGGLDLSPSMLMANLLHIQVEQADTAPKGVRYTYRDEDGEFCRYYPEDNKENRLKFIEALQATEFNYQESDLQKFLAHSVQFSIYVEDI